MKVSLLLKLLNTDGYTSFLLPDKKLVPQHFHITEVAKIQKEFYDCGGRKQFKEYVTIQIWVGDDVDHRLSNQKFSNILGNLSECDRELPLFIEYEFTTVGLYGIEEVIIPTTDQKIQNDRIIQLNKTRTECLAPDKCGLNEFRKTSCSSGCC